MPDPLLPDPETLLVSRLAAQSSITAITSTRIGTRIPSEPVYPLIRVAHVGGSPNGDGASAFAALQVDAWADDDATASLLGRTVVAVLRDLRAITGSGWVALTDITSGPLPVPDPDSQRHRYISTLEMRFGF